MLHTFAVYVDNKPGVLNRVSSLFRRRAFNIESLTVGHTETPGISRMTVVVDASDATQVVKQLDGLVEVIAVHDVTCAGVAHREMVLAKVVATGEITRVVVDAERFLGRL